MDKICDFEPDLNTRPNDAKCDHAGNFIVGGYNNNHRKDELNITGCWRLTKELLLEEIMDYRYEREVVVPTMRANLLVRTENNTDLIGYAGSAVPTRQLSAAQARRCTSATRPLARYSRCLD